MFDHNVIDTFNSFFLFAFSHLTAAVLVSTVIWIKPNFFLSSPFPQRSFRICVFSSILVTALFFILSNYFNLTENIINIIGIIATLSLLFRLMRMKYKPGITPKRINSLTCLDIVFLSVLILLLRDWFAAMFTGKIFSASNVIGFPIIYTMVCFYSIYNFTVISPGKVKLATWLILAYAFPEGMGHRRGQVGKPVAYGILSDLIGWIIALLLIFAAGLFGYWLSGYAEATFLYFAFVLIVTAVLVAKGSLKTGSNKSLGKFTTIIIGSGIIVGFLCLLIIFTNGRLLQSPTTIERLLLAMSICAPVMIFTVEFIADSPKKLSISCAQVLTRIMFLEAIRQVSDAARYATFGRQTTKTLQALVIALVFLIYFILPKSVSLLNKVGLSELNGESIPNILQKFEAISTNWVIPKTTSSEEIAGFFFGNQGIVLMFFLWFLVTLIAWNDVAARLNRVPNLLKTKFSKLVSRLHLVLFYIYFLPFLITLTFLILLAGAKLLDYSLAIILGVFSFGFFLPKIEAYLLSLGYLLITILNTDINDALDINRAEFKDLILLPGVGPKIAKRIISNRPYNRIADVMKIEGLKRSRFEALQDLIRI